MGLLGQLLQFGANAVQPALQVGAARNQAQIAANQMRQQQLLQMLVMQQKQRQADIEERLKNAQAQSAQATARYRDSQANRPQAPVLGSPDYLKAQTDLEAMRNSLKPQASEPLAQVIQNGKRIYVPRSKAAGMTAPSPEQPGVFVVDPSNPNAGPVYKPRDEAFGMAKPPAAGQGAGGAQAMSRAGQFGEMLKKSADLLPAMDKLDVSLGQSAASDVAQHGFKVLGMPVPGSSAVGSALVNRSPDFAAYQTMLDPFVLANAHALSGARINQDQAKMIKQSIEMKPNDPPNVRKQRMKNVVDQMNSTAASLPADMVSAQESQMDPETLQMLRSYGYRGGGSTAHRQTAGASATPDVNDVDSYLKHLRSRKP